MKFFKFLLFSALLSLSVINYGQANATTNSSTPRQTAVAQLSSQSNWPQRFFYAGLIGGYANVDWNAVIGQDRATLPTNPTNVNGNGALFGFDFGYQISHFFALEAQYIRMPTSHLEFSEIARITYGTTSMDSTMDFYALVLKIMVPLGNTNFSLFTEAGPAYQQRSDQIADIGTWAPTFGAGLNYRIDAHWFANAAFQYATGYGESIALPINEYIPEIYAGTFSINYIF